MVATGGEKPVYRCVDEGATHVEAPLKLVDRVVAATQHGAICTLVAKRARRGIVAVGVFVVVDGIAEARVAVDRGAVHDPGGGSQTVGILAQIAALMAARVSLVILDQCRRAGL